MKDSNMSVEQYELDIPYHYYEQWYMEQEDRFVTMAELMVTCVNAHYTEGMKLEKAEVI